MSLFHDQLKSLAVQLLNIVSAELLHCGVGTFI